MKLIINKKISLSILVLAIVATNLVTYFWISNENHDENEDDSVSETSLYASNSNCNYNIKRLSGYDYIKPILFVDSQCESDKLSPIKHSLITLIENYKNAGVLTSASVYIKEYMGNGWTGINSDEKFMPGSLMKVPELITFLKMEESNPGLLDKELLFNKIYIADKHPKYVSKSIQLHQRYTIRELLKYMIVYSDNNATSLLFENMNVSLFKKVFTDFGLTSPDITAQNYPISAQEFTYFMRALYNASYLNNKNSEFATELLGQCNFKDGIVASLPNSMKIAHKFGESGDPLQKQLSESAIIYLNNNPYTITIMTKGKDQTKLPEVIKQISSVVYQNMLNNSTTTSS